MLDRIAKLVPPANEKALRQGFYTAAAMLFVLAACTALMYVYFVLEIFMTPLMWALLTGSFLFPLKKSLNSALKSWMQNLQESDRLLIVATVLLPMSMFDNISDYVGMFFKARWKTFIVMLLLFFTLNVFIPTVHPLDLVGNISYYAVVHAWMGVKIIIEFWTPYQVVLATIFAAYVLAILIFEQSTCSWLSHFGILAWMSLATFVICAAGSIQVPLAIAVVFLVTLSVMVRVKQKIAEYGGPGQGVFACAQYLKNALRGTRNESKAIPGCSKPKIRRQKSADGNKKDDFKPSSLYFNILFNLLCITTAWSHPWIWLIFAFPLAYWGFKQIIIHDSIGNCIDRLCHSCFGSNSGVLKVKAKEYYERRKPMLYPPVVNSIFNMISLLDKKLRTVILARLPAITSVVIILSILLGLIMLSVFSVIQIHQESLLLLRMTVDLINGTSLKNSEYTSWLPENKLMLESVDTVIAKVYLYGKGWIKEKISEMLGGNFNSTMIENQALILWDRAYHLWSNKTVLEGPKLQQSRVAYKNVGYIDKGKLFSPVFILEVNEVVSLLKNNMSALLSVVESLFSVFQTNFKLLISTMKVVFMAFLYGGSAVLNFLVSVIVYLTALFYLLVESDMEYMPNRLISTAGNSGFWSHPVTNSVQDTVSGVFGASIKMASFYGLYTWTSHLVIGSTLIYIPSLLAAVFSVIPVVATYWCCLPAVLEFWILRGNLLRGSSLLFLQVLPTMFVDATIYQEMAGSGSGHPYITGLSVIGGLYYFGLDGAIIGPIILCVVLVVVNACIRVVDDSANPIKE